MRILLVTSLLVACSSSPTPRAPVAAPAAAATQAPAPSALAPAQPALRLPRNFLPTSYAARLAIDPAKPTFEGSIAITGDVAERSSVIWLHGRHLTVARATARQGERSVAIAVTPRGEDLLELRAATPLDAGRWVLALDYAGEVDEVSTAGVFRQTVAGATYVYTQLEATYARRVFPCFDEPDNKVPWQVTLDVPAGLVALSNTPAAREQALGGGARRVEFAPTPPMPSYLVAFAVGPFEIFDAGKTQSGKPVRVVAMKGRGAETGWAVKTAAPIVNLLERFFATPYPFAKLDLIAIPLTVGFGAMENAGLITFAESLMLLDPKTASIERKRVWVAVTAHEVAHQWFGNLVTTAWWDDIWLNEGFANWAEHKITAAFEPAWHEELSEVEGRNEALDADALVSARQIRQPIRTPDDIVNAFDGITYDKGAAVLAMFEGYLGSEVFLRGVRQYLADHAWGNATSRDFLAAIGKAAGKDVAGAFSTFLDQPGAPEITATVACEPGKPARLALRQQRFVPPGAPAIAAGTPWKIPVCVAFERGGARGEACTSLESAGATLELDAPSCPRWVMPNVGGRGYYRSAYTPEQAAALRDQAWPHLRPAERYAAAIDIGGAAQLAKLPVALAMSFVPKLLAAGDRFSVSAALMVPQSVDRYVPEAQRPAYAAWMRSTFGPAAHKVGLVPGVNDDLDVESTRTKLFRAAAELGADPELTAHAVKLAERWRDLPQSTRRQVVEIAARASAAVFERLLRDVYAETDLGRRSELFSALASSSDVARQRTALALMLDPKLDVRETRFMMFSAHGDANRVVAQDFFRTHKEEILRRMPAESTTGSPAEYAYVFTGSCVASRRAEIVDYITRVFQSMPGGPRTVAQAVEGLDQCIARRALLEPEIRRWLDGAAGGAHARARK